MNIITRRSLLGAFAGLGIVLSVALVAGLVHLTPSALGRAAASICWLGADGSYTCDTDEPVATPNPTYAPAALVSPAALPADAGAAASIHALEQQAVDLTLSQHGLPASDGDAVRTWARNDALANLWGLIVRAGNTPAAQRTTVQRDAVAWMADKARGQAIYAATSAGAQYARWAGLDMATYAQKSGSASRADLTSFLTTDAQPYRGSGGYCNYRSPAPYAGEYQGYQVQMCFTPCTSWVCQAPRPSYDQFVRWGAAVATSHLSTDAINDQAAVITHAALVGLAGSAFAGVTYYAANAALYIALAGETFSVVGSMAAFVGGPAAMVLAAVTGVVLSAINLAAELETPGKLADLVVGAREATYDPAAMLKTDDGRTTLFALFAEATGPAPRTDKTCDNSLIPAHLYGSATQDQATIRDANGKVVTVMTYPCLNPTPIPAASGQDPHFVVRSVFGGTVTGSASISLNVPGPSGQGGETVSLRASGGWWVVTHADGSEALTLDTAFTAWDGKPRTASIAREQNGAYTFRGLTTKGVGGVAAATCVADQTCWSGGQMPFTRGNLVPYTAQLVAP